MNPPDENPRETAPPARPAKATPPAGPNSLPPLNIASEHPVDPSQLTPEEQMALYEKDLKENDWGHQPC